MTILFHKTVLRITDNRFFVSLFEAGNRYAEESDHFEKLFPLIRIICNSTAYVRSRTGRRDCKNTA